MTKKMTKKTATKPTRKPYIICGGAAGRAVIFCWLDADPVSEQTVVMHDARMVLYWPTACGGLLGLAANGPRDGLRLTAPVARVTDTVRQSLSVTPAAAKALEGWPSV